MITMKNKDIIINYITNIYKRNLINNEKYNNNSY